MEVNLSLTEVVSHTEEYHLRIYMDRQNLWNHIIPIKSYMLYFCTNFVVITVAQLNEGTSEK